MRKKQATIAILTLILALTTGCGKEKEYGEMTVYPEEGTTQEADAGIEEAPATGNEEGTQPYNNDDWASLTSEDATYYTDTAPNGKPITAASSAADCVVLPDLSQIQYIYEEAISTATEESIRTQALLHKEAHITNDPNTTARLGDKVYVSVNVASTDGLQFPSQNHDSLYVPLGSATLPSQIERSIVGMRVGEAKKITILFPEDDFESGFAGLEMEYTITMLSIARPDEPTEEELKEQQKLAETIGERNAELDAYNAIRQELVTRTAINAYPIYVVDGLRDEYRKGFFTEGTLPEYLETVGISMDDFMISENEYIWPRINARMVSLALQEKLGINEESEAYIAYARLHGRDYTDPDNTMFKVLINELMKQYGDGPLEAE